MGIFLLSMLFISSSQYFKSSEAAPHSVSIEKISNSASQPQNLALLVAAGVRSKVLTHYPEEGAVFGAYDLLTQNGIPPSNIIVMSYDDAPNDEDNPCKGKLFNTPEWRNVYDPNNVDYRGFDVTPENVLSVLRGDSAAVRGGNGRVIESTSVDRLFVFLVGDGIPNALIFQNLTRLWAEDLVKTLLFMKENGKYAEMVIYLDTDSGGELLKHIPDDISVYAVSNTNSQFAPKGYLFCDLWHCNGTVPCLTTEYSSDWQEDCNKSDITTKTFYDQVETMKNLTEDYELGMGEYGDLSIGKKPMGCFMSARKHYENQFSC